MSSAEGVVADVIEERMRELVTDEQVLQAKVIGERGQRLTTVSDVVEDLMEKLMWYIDWDPT